MPVQKRDKPIVLTEAQLRDIVKDAVSETLISMGIDAADPIEMQKDFQHLREWRTATRALQKRGLLTIVGVLVAGGMAALWLGFRGMLSG